MKYEFLNHPENEHQLKDTENASDIVKAFITQAIKNKEESKSDSYYCLSHDYHISELLLLQKQIEQTPSPTGDRDCGELKKEVERLKGLLMQSHIDGFVRGMSPKVTVKESWDVFCKENNL